MIGGFSCHKLSVNRDTKNPKKRAARSQNCLRPPTKTKSTWESKREIFQKSHVPSPVLSQTNRRNIWVVRPSGFVMESTAKDFGAKISEPWGKDGKGLSKTGCNWQTPRMFGLLPNNIGYTSGILTKHRYYGYILGIPAGTYPLVYFYILMVGTRLREQYGGHWGGGACASRIGWLTNEWYNDIYIYMYSIYIYTYYRMTNNMK